MASGSWAPEDLLVSSISSAQDTAFDQNRIIRNDVPFLAHQFPSFPGTELDAITSSGCQTRDDIMTAYQGMSGASPLGGMTDRNFVNAISNGVRNFHMYGLEEEARNSSWHLTDLNRIATNFSASAPEIPQNLEIAQRAYDNKDRDNASTLDNWNKLDGRFLSLGYQSNSDFGIQSGDCGSNASHMSMTSSHGQLADYSTNNMGVTLSHNDHGLSRLRATIPEFSQSSIPMLPGGETNTHHFVPTPSNITSGRGKEIGTRFFSSDISKGYVANPAILSNVSGNSLGLPEPTQKRTGRIPFDSYVLKSNHEIGSEQMQNSCLRTNMEVPSFGGVAGGSGRLHQSGLVLGSTTSSVAQAVEGDNRYTKAHMVHPAGQGAAIRVENERSYPSITPVRGSHKRRLDSASTEDQRRKVMPQGSTYPFSPYLLQNALAQNVQSTPSFPSCANPSLIPTAVMKGSAAGASATFPTAAWNTKSPNNAESTLVNPTATAEAFSFPTLTPTTCGDSEEISLAFPSSIISSPAAFANISSIPVVAAENPIPLPPSSSSIRAPTGLRTASAPTGVSRIPVTPSSSKRVSRSPNVPASVTAPRKTSLSHSRPTLTTPPVIPLRRSLPAALAKAPPTYRALQSPASMPHIKWQGFDTPQTSGEKCLLCKRDLSYAPEGPVSVPPIPPPAAVLPCGHTFHDHCLALITPADQSKNPPCIPCAIGEK